MSTTAVPKTCIKCGKEIAGTTYYGHNNGHFGALCEQCVCPSPKTQQYLEAKEAYKGLLCVVHGSSREFDRFVKVLSSYFGVDT